MGLGVWGGGLGVARFLLQHGARVTITDLLGPEALEPSLLALRDESVELVLGAHRAVDFETHDLIIRNPSVPLDSPFLELARKKGIPIETEMEIFFRLVSGRVIAVTGTKGKSTTVSLIQALLRRRFPETKLVGNIGQSALGHLPLLRPDTFIVVELSSFQLETLTLSQGLPEVAVLTNVAPHHLDHHHTFQNYLAAKGRLLSAQTSANLALLNGGDEACRAFQDQTAARIVWFGQIAGTHQPGYLWKGDRILHRNGGFEASLCELPQIPLRGDHNRENVLAAVAAVHQLDLWEGSMVEVLHDFKPLPGRLELVGEIGGVRFTTTALRFVRWPQRLLSALWSRP